MLMHFFLTGIQFDFADYLERALSDHDIPGEYEERHQSKPPGTSSPFVFRSDFSLQIQKV